MANEMYVEMGSLEQLKAELETALTNFTNSFNNLENGINALTQKGFIGEGGVTFKQSFEGQPKTSLEEVKRDTRDTIDYMERKIASANQMFNNIDDIASGNR